MKKNFFSNYLFTFPQGYTTAYSTYFKHYLYHQHSTYSLFRRKLYCSR